MLTVAFGESIMSTMQVQLLYKRFKEGREDVNDDAQLKSKNRSSTADENIEAVELLLERLLMVLAYHTAHAKQFLRMF